MRTVQVTAPEDVQWDVRVVWQPRWRSLARRFDECGEARPTGCLPSFGSLDISEPGGLVALMFIAIGGTILASLVWWIVLPLLLMIVDLAVVIVLLVAAIGARVMFRRPWTVEATASDGRAFTAHVVGWRAALRRRDEIADRLSRGKRPWRRHRYRRKVRQSRPR